MKKLFRFCVVAGLALAIIVPFACKKESTGMNAAIPEGQQRVKIFLTDNPVNYDAVYVDIQQIVVQVIPDSCQGRDNNRNDCFDDDEYRCSVWDTLNIRAGVYNLLNLSNGVDTILANGLTISGRVNKLKMVLGTNNSVVIDSVRYPLTLNGNNNTVTIQVKGADIDQLNPDELQFWLDFDAGASIVKVSNNRFVLKPKLKVFVPATTGAIAGKVFPKEAKPVVSAISNGDTLVAFPFGHNGKFMIRGLRGTTADIFINATAGGYRDTTITGVTIKRGETKDIGTIQLRR